MCNIYLVSLAVLVININPYHSIEIVEQEFYYCLQIVYSIVC